MTTSPSPAHFSNSSRRLRQRVAFLLIWASLTAISRSSEPVAFNIGTQGSAGSHYTLSDGVLATSGTTVGPNGVFDHLGGRHEVVGELSVTGGLVLSGGGAAYAFYSLTGGTLDSISARISVAVFSQSGGTNRTGDLTIGPHNAQCTLNLSGGRIETRTSTLAGSWRGCLNQSGGIHHVAERLRIVGDDFFVPTYLLQGGELYCGEIEIARGTLAHQGGEATVSGPVILNAGVWEAGPVAPQLGPLHLAATAGGISTLRLPGRSGVLRFADSSAVEWAAEGLLTVEAWNGSLRGGGVEQVIFGNTMMGLSSAQLHQVRFKDPAGCPPGFHPARILPTGEIVPGPYLDSTRHGGAMTLQWDEGFVLQSSQSPTGPFEDVHGAVSPYVVEQGGHQFFRLRE